MIPEDADNHIGLVVHIAKKFENSILPLSERVQEGVIGLMMAIRKFDPERGVKFSTYAGFWIQASISRANKTEIRRTQLIEHIDLNVVEQKVGLPEDIKLLIRDLGDKIQSRERMVIFMRYGIDFNKTHTFEEIGKIMGITRQRAQQLEAKGIERMRAVANGIKVG